MQSSRYSRALHTLFAVLAAVIVSGTVHAQSLSVPETLIERYADIQLNTAATDKATTLAALLQEADHYREAHQDEAAAWISAARIRAGYARTVSQLKALELVKQVRTDLETAIKLDPAAQGGMAQGFLGTLYLSLPGWPLSFGDEKKGVQLLKDSLAADGTSSTSNFFYAQHLVSRKQYAEARQYLTKADSAIKADVAHPHWQKMQQANIDSLLKRIVGGP